MAIVIDEGRREVLTARLRGFFLEEFDEEVSPCRAEQILDFVLTEVGPQVYNQAVQDARGYMQKKLDDLDGEIHQPQGL